VGEATPTGVSTSVQLDRSHRQFVLRRLHSLTGIVPIGAYLIFHIMLANASVLGGPERFNSAVAAISSLPPPILFAVEMFAIYLPLLFHALYGFVRIREAELDNPLRNDHVGAYLYSLQRLSGVVAFFFIGWHVYTTRMQYYFANTEISYDLMHGMMTNPVKMTVFLVGTLAAVFHFTNGIWTFCITWGITVGQRAQRQLRAASMGFFVVMYGTAVAILMAFRA
jgi:succinate dehydrogenase / fumarate reductase cytochrome b subunit